MQIPVLIEKIAGNGYLASSGQRFGMTAEGTSHAEVLQRLRQGIEERLGAGASVVPLEINVPRHPLAPFAGMLKDDPLLQEWKQAMADYRREIEENPNF